ncbi:hypothetical protein [Bradyrhizobium sp.]|uniref:hypothetical protein n=1 Tax=Bradyrhizobium sp. TaxID=376 RepID=UPI001D558528|nr:hypothetical protein [Bradyrhizobium sp.]MBI5321476.1 hypothetical protein [Bradyrhizobium sp.]
MLAVTATISARADDCSNEKSLKSVPSTAVTELSFQNRSAEKRRIYWIDDDGDRKFYGIVEPGNVFKQPTFANHAWVVTDDAEKCLYTFVATAEPRAVDVGEASAAIAAPPAGAQQPIAQAAPPPPAPPPPAVAPPPPAAQAAPPAAQAAPPPASQDPTTVIASTAAEPLPQVSPVEQFRLSGAYRLTTQLDGKMLNSQAGGTIEVVAGKPEWDSGQWIFEPVSGTPFVRIRNKWKGTYLADFNGKPRAMPAAPNATEAQWTFEPVDGTPYVQFRNRESDRFLLAINGAAALVDDFRQEMENNSLWRTLPAASAVAAPPPLPQRPLYDSAVSNCRQIGGYWTGSSCRRPVYITQPLVCPRGYAWSEDVGECQWDGGSCPPWQVGPGGACLTDLVCQGGVVRISRRGYPACYCPIGYVVWGDYPRLSCVPSVARIAPLLIGGAAIAVLGANQGRPTIGQVYGNKQFCPPGQTGTPPNCVVAQTCPPPLVGKPPNCLRLVQKPTVPVVLTPTQPTTPPPPTLPPPVVGGGGTGTCPAGQTGTPPNCVTAAVTCTGGTIAQGVCGCPAGTRLTGGGNSFQCVAANVPNPPTNVTVTPGGTPATPVCSVGQRVVDGRCVDLNAAITCTGGKVEQGVCGCPQGTRLTGSGNNFQCVTANVPNAPTNVTIDGSKPTTPPVGQRACNAGENPQTANCQCNAPLQVFDNKCQRFTTIAPTTPPGGQRACTAGENPQSANCQCRSPLQVFDNKCQQFTTIAPTTPAGGQRACNAGEIPQSANCQCRSPLQVSDGKCQASTTTAQPVGGPPLCTDGQNTASGCRCAAPLTVLPGGKCAQPTKPGAACLEGQNIAATGCVCGPPLKQIENGFCGRLLLNETKPLAKGGTCAEGADIKATGCQCNMNTVDAGGGKFICSANRPAGGGTTTTPAGGPPLCTDGQNTASGCRCAAPLTVLPGGKCGQPTKGGAPCLEGQNIAATGCVCGPPLKQIENGFCGRLLLNETKPLNKGGNATPPRGGERLAPGPTGGAVAPVQTCPAGQTGTPPNCKSAAPIACPAGQVGTPPNCRPAPPATCPSGQVGTPPNCRPAPPATCPSGQVGTPPSGQVGTPPNCRPAPSATCPSGQIGTPPNCRPAPPAACPSGQIGTPPNCRPAPPATCPPGTTGTPPNCLRPPPKPPTPPTPPACAPPKKLNATGQCV